MTSSPPLVTEHFVSLPVTQLRLCVRIWNAEGADSSATPSSSAAAAASASFSVAGGCSPAAPAVRPQDVHVVLVHGWLDNAHSWNRFCSSLIAAHTGSNLAKALDESAPKGVSPSRLVCYCIELSGHGRSDHRTPGGGLYFPSEHTLDVLQALAQLGLVRGHEAVGEDATNAYPSLPRHLHLIGHSMGGAVVGLVAGALGPLCTSLVLMDSIGPWWTPEQVPEGILDSSFMHMANALQEHDQAGNTVRRHPKLYATEAAIVTKYVGSAQFMEAESARILARGAIRFVALEEQARWSCPAGPGAPGWDQALAKAKGGWCFRHDNILIASPIMRPLEETTLLSFNLVSAPTLLFLATNARRREVYRTVGRDPRSPTHHPLPDTNPAFGAMMRARLDAFPTGVRMRRVVGDHHIHIDSASYALLARETHAFIHTATQRAASGVTGRIEGHGWRDEVDDTIAPLGQNTQEQQAGQLQPRSKL